MALTGPQFESNAPTQSHRIAFGEIIPAHAIPAESPLDVCPPTFRLNELIAALAVLSLTALVPLTRYLFFLGPGVTLVSIRDLKPIRIGVLEGEPIRLEGLTMIFEGPPPPDKPQLIPIIGTLEDLLIDPSVEYLVVDLNSATGGLHILELVRRSRPGMRQIVIGPEHDDEKVLEAIVAGARAYLDSSASPQTVRMAIDVVVSGSIWAPRRLLSKLIDRLLGVPESHLATPLTLQLTARERQVLELILLARSNREIARQLGIEERTVKAHVGRLMRKTGADNRIELSMRALNRSLVAEPEQIGKTE
jgi:DNA-binding NarL/FixJ family response regulator